MLNIEWGTVADWVSGIGSLSASVVAIYLARFSHRIRLTHSFTPAALFYPDGRRDPIFSISATNVSTRPTTITNISFNAGRGDKAINAVIQLQGLPGSSSMPATLADGQSASWNIPEKFEHEWLNKISAGMANKGLEPKDLSNFSFVIHTSNGGLIKCKPDKRVISILADGLHLSENKTHQR